MMNERLQTLLRQLRLSGLAQSLDVRIQEAAGHQLNYVEFLELILQDELLVRNQRQIERRVKVVQFRELKATRSTMMTSNRPLEDWGKLIGDVPSATAILDRFLHHAEIVTITGKSYRLRGKSEDASTNSSPMADGAEAKSKTAIPSTGSSGEKAPNSDGHAAKTPPTKP